ncbi:enoyl-CoA hydratase/isomerase family protein [Mycobacterium ulcerans str. Harvey]|uniref:Enoyl-CoA hydratase/isomerase family protein n=1 Tax=Mycobacterium ulcerans str. Harvey TaxID=1299332 RepID=A0ABN0QQ91_MYCUL|nr:enoyl-CoA hydratase/isomerase family protein [Mycobacterium ulcerans str. Harvey]
MTITSTTAEPGIVAITVDYPPVNAIPSRGWFELADALTAAGADLETRAVILRADGRGFNAGVDIKEMQRTEGFTALIDANRGCFAAFRAVYECAVPVIAAVNGFCVGGASDWSATPMSSSPPRTPPSVCRRWSGARSAPQPTSPGWFHNI